MSLTTPAVVERLAVSSATAAAWVAGTGDHSSGFAAGDDGAAATGDPQAVAPGEAVPEGVAAGPVDRGSPTDPTTSATSSAPRIGASPRTARGVIQGRRVVGCIALTSF